ncbi:hypothetical protein GTP38_01875 [Duganella sp. FT94W]|uniref:Uncharacterized protein n=1 Tax=Duganella lactea TaxID=2692173 RepID=A0ABW9V0H8_9BURK|nr:hypothetical protein [Duganella lactea]MYM33095.1 hypothetical protein [Duganella lactea]
METVTESRWQELPGQLNATVAPDYRAQLAKRIASLMPHADQPDDVAMSLNSVRSLLQFLARHPELKCPEMTVTPSGDIYASWQKDRSCVFSVQFMDNGQARFVVLRLESAEQLSGLTSPVSLMATVAPLNVMAWAGNER